MRMEKKPLKKVAYLKRKGNIVVSLFQAKCPFCGAENQIIRLNQKVGVAHMWCSHLQSEEVAPGVRIVPMNVFLHKVCFVSHSP